MSIQAPITAQTRKIASDFQSVGNSARPAFSGFVSVSEKPERVVSDALRFGQKERKPAEENTGFSMAQRLKSGLKLGSKLAFHPKSVLTDFLWSALFSAATFWLPGSQLMTVPFIMGAGVALRAARGIIEGYTHPELFAH